MTTTTAAAVPVPRTRARYTRVGALGLTLLGLVPAVFLVAGVAAGLELGDELGFFAVFIVVPLVAAGLVWRFGTWAKVVGAIVGLGGVMMFWAVFGLAYPASFVDFVPAVMWVLGLVLAVGGNIAAIVRRRHQAVEASTGERRVQATALTILALAVAVSGVLTFVQRDTVDASAAAGAGVITAKDFQFEPRAYEVAAGETTRIVVHNADPFVHTFTSAELGIDELLTPGSSVLIEVSPEEAGTFLFWCTPHSGGAESDPDGDDMAGTITAT